MYLREIKMLVSDGGWKIVDRSWGVGEVYIAV